MLSRSSDGAHPAASTIGSVLTPGVPPGARQDSSGLHMASAESTLQCMPVLLSRLLSLKHQLTSSSEFDM
jgi:hypothetical protein